MRLSTTTELAEASIPNSVAYRKSNLEKAQEVLLIAKSIPRKVRRAKPNECEFSREIANRLSASPKLIKEREDGLITAQYAKDYLGISLFTIQEQRKKGLLPFKKEKAKYYYNPEDLKKIETKKYNKRK